MKLNRKKAEDINKVLCSGDDRGCKISNLSPINYRPKQRLKLLFKIKST